MPETSDGVNPASQGDSNVTATPAAQSTPDPSPSESQADLTAEDIEAISRLATPAGTQGVDAQVDKGTLTRIQQQNAQLRKALVNLGMDPDSDDVNNLSSLRRTPQPTESAKTPTDPRQRLSKTIDKVQEQKGVTLEDFLSVANAMYSTIENLDQRESMKDEQSNVRECLQTVNGVLAGDPVHSKLPENIRAIEAELFVAGTDYSLMNEAKSRGIDMRPLMTPQNYQGQARKMAERLNALRNYYISVGAKPKAPNPNIPNPIGNSTGSSPAVPHAPTSMVGKGVKTDMRAYIDSLRRV